MTKAYFSSLPPLKQKVWGNFHDCERALVTTEQEKQCVGENTFQFKNCGKCTILSFIFFIFTLLMLLFCYTSLVTIFTFLDSLFLNGYGNIKYGLVQSLNVIVNYSYARTEGCLQNVQLGYEETVYFCSTLGLNTYLFRQT